MARPACIKKCISVVDARPTGRRPAVTGRLHSRFWSETRDSNSRLQPWQGWGVFRNQELNFRAINQATAFKQIHGYGKQLVDNVTVLTRQDELNHQIPKIEEQQLERHKQLVLNQGKLHDQRKLVRRIERRQDTVERNIKDLQAGKKLSPKHIQLIKEQKKLRKVSKSATSTRARFEKRVTNLESKLERNQDRIDSKREELLHIKGRSKILQHDTELDSLFSLLKVGLTLLITYVLREYLGNAKMDPATFLARFATLPAWRKLTPQLELLTFEYNSRDPEMMALLADSCDTINNRSLRMRGGRILQVAVDLPPPSSRAPPNRRSKTKDRFRGS